MLKIQAPTGKGEAFREIFGRVFRPKVSECRKAADFVVRKCPVDGA